MYAVEKCKIPGYFGDQRSTSRETHQAHENRKNYLILNMTPEKQDKTEFRIEQTLFCRLNTNKKLSNNGSDISSESVKCDKICSNNEQMDAVMRNQTGR